MQASKQQIFETVIRPLEAGYRPLKSKDREPVQYGEMVDQMVTTIHGQSYAADILNAGMDRFRAEWRVQRWPVAGELLDFFDQATGKGTEAIAPPPKLTGGMWAHRIMSGDWGKQAVRRGIANDLDVWAWNNPGDYPSGDLLDKFEREARVTTAKIRNDPKYQSDKVKALYEAMQGRERMLAAKYGEPEPLVDIADPINALAAG